MCETDGPNENVSSLVGKVCKTEERAIKCHARFTYVRSYVLLVSTDVCLCVCIVLETSYTARWLD